MPAAARLFFKLARSLDILHDPFAAFRQGERAGVWAGFRLHHRESVDNLAKFQIVLLPSSQSLGSWLGVTLSAPVPNSLSTYLSAIIGISRPMTGTTAFCQPVRHESSSSGWTQMAVAPGMVSGLVVAMVIEPSAIGKPVADMPEKTVLVLPVNLVIGKGCLAARAPVDHVVAAINQPFVVKLDKNLAHGPLKTHSSIVKRSLLQSTEQPRASDLFQNAMPIFVAPFPDALHKDLRAQDHCGQAPLWPVRSTTFWVEMPAWSVPGILRVFFAHLTGVAAKHIYESQVEGVAYMQGRR